MKLGKSMLLLGLLLGSSIAQADGYSDYVGSFEKMDLGQLESARKTAISDAAIFKDMLDKIIVQLRALDDVYSDYGERCSGFSGKTTAIYSAAFLKIENNMNELPHYANMLSRFERAGAFPQLLSKLADNEKSVSCNLYFWKKISIELAASSRYVQQRANQNLELARLAVLRQEILLTNEAVKAQQETLKIKRNELASLQSVENGFRYAKTVTPLQMQARPGASSTADARAVPIQ
ncbi:MAG: hypothetical protein HY074_13755 [Deltaproteobacteria bacterium]|nr:hypothetical protein [Deltaproteobacteria bacterium]